MVDDLNIRSVRLMTNNPAKVEALEALGIAVVREPHEVPSNEVNRGYLITKRDRMRHQLTQNEVVSLLPLRP